MQICEKRTIFTSGKGQCPVYRIPGITITAGGTILVYCEGRSANSDWSATDILLRRSDDQGETWSEPESIASMQDNSPVNNPVMIAAVDGRVHFLWESQYCRAFYQKSDDDCKTFSKPVDITGVLEVYRDKDAFNWNVFAFGPGHGTQLSNGRLVVPTWLANGKGRSHSPTVISSIYSDDGGRHWHSGEIQYKDDDIREMNESCMAELSDGSVLFNIRNHSRRFLRAVSLSPNGYDQFSRYMLDEQLPDPVCCAGMVNGVIEGQRAVLFSNCAVRPAKDNFYDRSRKKLTLRISYDDCKTWGSSRMLEYRSGYSDIAVSNDGKWIYCFYEQDTDDTFLTEPRHLTIAKVNLEWLSD